MWPFPDSAEWERGGWEEIGPRQERGGGMGCHLNHAAAPADVVQQYTPIGVRQVGSESECG